MKNISEYSGRNLKGKSFRGEDLRQADFKGANLLGADFTSAQLTGADFSGVVTGMRISSKVFLFVIVLGVSLLSGYMAMQTGNTVQEMVKSTDPMVRIGGYITLAFLIIFAAVALWKGVFKAIRKVFLIMICIAVVLGLFMYLTGLGTGMGAVKGSLALILFVLMFIVGTISRATAGTLASTILFLIVALGGGVFGRSLGGGIGTILMAASCAVISKRALKPGHTDSFLQKVALTISSWFGTSFKGADLTNTNFSNSVIRNTDFSGACLSGIKWTDAKKEFILGDIEIK